MKNTLCVLVFLLAASAAAGDYVVGYGDTLWDISIWFYGTPEKWEEILAANPEVRGVEYLVPGMTLYIPNAATDYTAQSSAGISEIPAGAIVIRSSEPILSRLQRESAGFVIYSPLDPVGYIVSTNAEEEGVYRHLTALPGDLVELDTGSSDGILEGHVFHILRPGERVTDPETDAEGTITRVAGVCRVIQTTPATSVALVEHGYIPVKEGDAVVPYVQSEDIRIENTPDVDALSVWVLGFRDLDRECAYTYDVVYLSGGDQLGISPGDVFTAYAHGEQLRDHNGNWVTTADIPVADLVVLTTEARSSAAMIVSSRTADLIEAGDRLYLSGSQID